MGLIDLEIFDALPVQLEPTHSRLVLVGCGGTGSWLAPSLVRIARLMNDLGHRLDVLFVDFDKVEQKNVYRQNFCDQEIGRYKSEVLALRYSAAWGMQIAYVRRRLENKDLKIDPYHGTPIVIDCVDNTRARAQINAMLADGAWWISCGNEKSDGQVLVGRHGIPEELDKFFKKGKTLWLPDPAMQMPGLVDPDRKEVLTTKGNLSCAEMALEDSQGLAINQTIASIAADKLVRLLVTGTLHSMATYIDFESGSMRSIYTTEANIRRAWEESK